MGHAMRIRVATTLLAALAVLASGTTAKAQGDSGKSPSSTSTASPARSGQYRNANTPTPGLTSTPSAAAIYSSPYMNPFLNPLAGQGQYSRQELAMYMWAAQQSTVGIGTGRLSGSSGDSRNMNGKPEREIANRVPARTPGGSAAGFFQRGAAAPREARFQRANTHFFSNGH